MRNTSDLTGRLVIIYGDSFQLQIAVPVINARLVDTVLLGDNFPELQRDDSLTLFCVSQSLKQFRLFPENISK